MPALPTVLAKGTFAARPAANTLPKGALYSATDTNVIYQVSDTFTWETYVTAGGAGTPAGSDKASQYNDNGAFGGAAVNATATKKYLQQISSGAPSMEQVAAADVSGLAPSATTDTTNAGNITSGTLPIARIGANQVGPSQLAQANADKLLGRGNGAGAGNLEEITLGANLTMTGTTLAATSGVNNPGGADKNVQYNDAGAAFGGVANNATATNKFLRQVSSGTPSMEQVSDADLATSDITTNDVSTSKHGFAPKAPNDATKYLDGTGAYTVPAGGGGGAQLSYPVADIVRARGLDAVVAGNFTIGTMFACVAAATLNGFKFSWDGSASKTIKWTLYDNGYDATGSTVVETNTQAVSAAQVYAITLATPKTLEQGKYYTVALYVNDGSGLNKYTTLLAGWRNYVTATGGGQTENTVGPVKWNDIALYAAGDAKPRPGNGSNACPLQLTYA